MSVALDKARDIWLDWFQPWSFSALCSFRAGEEPFWTLVFLPGYYRPMEEATLQALELLLAARRSSPVTTELRRLEERPVVAVTAWRRPPVTVDQHEAVQWSICLAVAYFERAAARKAAMPPDLQEI